VEAHTGDEKREWARVATAGGTKKGANAGRDKRKAHLGEAGVLLVLFL
jgi:hypothetical protein